MPLSKKPNIHLIYSIVLASVAFIFLFSYREKQSEVGKWGKNPAETTSPSPSLTIVSKEVDSDKPGYLHPVKEPIPRASERKELGKNDTYVRLVSKDGAPYVALEKTPRPKCARGVTAGAPLILYVDREGAILEALDARTMKKQPAQSNIYSCHFEPYRQNGKAIAFITTLPPEK